MSNSCNELNVRPIKVSELANYSSLKSDDIILTIQKNGSNFYSRKTTFGSLVNSITQLTASISGNLKGNVIGNLQGNVTGDLNGNVTGLFQGTINNSLASITGIPFTTLNDHNISFDGTGSYSVSSSYSTNSNYSKNCLSSSYSLSSSYALTNYADDALSSSYSATSSISDVSKVSLSSNYAVRSSESDQSDYSLDGAYATVSLSSSYAYQSSYNKSSSYSLTSSYAKKTNISTSASYASVSNTVLTPPIANFGIEYFYAFAQTGDRVDNYVIYDSTKATTSNDLVINFNKQTKDWRKITLNNIPPACGATGNRRIPKGVKYILLNIRGQVYEDRFTTCYWTQGEPAKSYPIIPLLDLGTADNESGGPYVAVGLTVMVPITNPDDDFAEAYGWFKPVQDDAGGDKWSSLKISVLGIIRTTACVS